MAIGATSKIANNASATAATAAVNTRPSGSILLCLFCWANTANFTSIADTINGAASGNTWTQIGTEVANAGSNLKARAYYVENASGGNTHVVTVTVSASVSGITALLIELTGMATASALDGSSFVDDTSSPYLSGNVVTTVNACQLIGGMMGGSNSNPATHAISSASPTSGWTIQTGAEETNGASFFTGCLASVDVSSTGTYNSGFTQSGGVGAAVLLAVFKELPRLTAEPADASAYNSETAAFSVTATGSDTLTYQWQVSTDRCASYANVGGGSGATTADYTTATLVFADHETFYRCAVTDSVGTANTRGAALRIKPKASGAWLQA